jgi:hypothetical protein
VMYVCWEVGVGISAFAEFESFVSVYIAWK